jgi:hypothetical protein
MEDAGGSTANAADARNTLDHEFCCPMGFKAGQTKTQWALPRERIGSICRKGLASMTVDVAKK